MEIIMSDLSNYRIGGNNVVRTAIICVDAQKEFLSNEELSELTRKLTNLIRPERDLISTIFLNESDSSWCKVMNWRKCFNSILPDGLRNISNYIIEKTTYTLDVSLLPNYTRVYLCGAELDGCILSTAFKLWDAGVNFKIVEDLCYCKPAYVESAKQIIMHVFGNDIFINSGEIM